MIRVLWTQRRRIHARASSMPPAERRRKLERPLETFRSPGIADKLRNTESRIVLSPTKAVSGRCATANYRERLQLSKSPADLLQCINEALSSASIDASVFGVAFQRCGQSRWWNALLQARKKQLESGVVFETLLLGQFLTALAKCARGFFGFGFVEERQAQLVPMGRLAWNEALPHTAIDGISVCAAFNLCAAASEKDSASLEWARELYEWALSQQMRLDVIHYSAFSRVLELHNMSDEVDKIIEASKQTNWSPNPVFLGGLVNVAAERYDWQRAEYLWRRLSDDFAVKPTSLSCHALAKAQLLSGRPTIAVQVLDDMLALGCGLTAEAAETQIQCLLIEYHSSLSFDCLCRLQDAFRRGKAVIDKPSSPGRQLQVLHKMWEASRCLCTSPTSVLLHDVIIEWKATRSKMMEWSNHTAGSNYLEDSQCHFKL